MMRFRAASFGAVMNNLGLASSEMYAEELMELPEDSNASREVTLQMLNDAKRSLGELPLSRVVVLQYERLIKDVSKYERRELALLVKELQRNIVGDLSSAYALIIPAKERELYEQREPVFGPKVASAFPDAKDDVAAAGRCLALDEWTACVFHLMRVLEHGLRVLAAKVGLPRDAVAHENWKNVIDQIESEIRKLESQPRSAEKAARVQALSNAAVQFRYFKDAWRNHVSHARAKYDGRDAEVVWSHVKMFMAQMADEVSEDQE